MVHFLEKSSRVTEWEKVNKLYGKLILVFCFQELQLKLFQNFRDFENILIVPKFPNDNHE